MSHYSQFKTSDPGTFFNLLTQFPFATIIPASQAAGELQPLLHAPVIAVSEKSGHILEFHMARGNPSFEHFKNGGKIRIVLNGPNAHVSPAWYKERFKNSDRSRTAPTFNYVAAQVDCYTTPMDDATLEGHLGRLVENLEDPVTGWKFSEIDPETLKGWMQHIAGFKAMIVANSIMITQKLSETPKAGEANDIVNIIEGLNNRGQPFDSALARLMEQHHLKIP